jgi:hypothetical protein
MLRDGLAPGPVLERSEKYLLMINHPRQPPRPPQPLRVQGTLEDS